MRFFSASLQTAVRPRLACEIAADGVATAGSPAMDAPLEAAAFVPASGAIAAGLSGPIFPDRGALSAALKSAFELAGASGREWTVVVPDECARVLLLDFDTLPAKAQDVKPLIRFRLRRMVPFDIDAAAVSYQLVKRTGASSNGGKAARAVAAAMPAEIRDEIESAVREQDGEPGALLPAALAALAAVPDAGSHLMVHTGAGSVTTVITREGELLLYRHTDLSNAEPSEMAQAVLVAAAYYEDTLQTQLEQVWVAGLETPELLRVHLEMDGTWQIPLRSLVDSQAFASGAAPAGVAAGRFASVVGALRG